MYIAWSKFGNFESKLLKCTKKATHCNVFEYILNIHVFTDLTCKKKKKTLNNYIVIIIIAAFIMRTYPSQRGCSRRNILLLPRSLDTISRPHLQCTISTPKGAFLAELPIVAFRQIHTQHILHILPGTHLYTWVESSNVDKVSCWRTKVPGMDGNRTRNPLIQSQGLTPIYQYANCYSRTWNNVHTVKCAIRILPLCPCSSNYLTFSEGKFKCVDY